MPRTVEQAIAYAATHRTTEPDGCQKECRIAYDVPSDGTPSAAADWAKSKRRHATSDPKAIPRGGLVRWTGGSHGYGHVAIATGGGKCWSTDILVRGRRDLVDIDLIRRRWGLTLVGWTDDIDGVQVLDSQPVDKPKISVKKKRPPEVQAAIEATKAAMKANAGKPTRLTRIKAALKALRKVKAK